MFSVTIPLFILSIAPTLTLADQCSVCTGFDENSAIDATSIMSSIMGSMDGDSMDGDNNNNRKRFLQDDLMSLSSCGDLKSALEAASDDTECSLYSVVAYSFCGCTDAPPADSCLSCPFGGTFDKDLVPDLDFENDGPSLTGTCGEVAATVSILNSFISAFTDGFTDALENANGGGDNGGGNENGGGDVSMSGDIDIDMCGMVQSSCGCNSNPDACMICEYGVENPDFAGDFPDDDNRRNLPNRRLDSRTCGDGLTMMQVMADTIDKNTTMCAEGQKQFEEAGCICATTSASTNKNIVTLLVVSAATTMVAFLW